MKKCQECEKVKLALAKLVDLYVANIGTDSEFICCITPKSAHEMNYFERRKCEIWSAWDAARVVLKGKYTIQQRPRSEKITE